MDVGSVAERMTNLHYKLLDADHIEIAGRRHRFYVLRGRDSIAVWLDGRTYYVPLEGNRATHGTASQSGEVSAIMPGKLLRVNVSVGDTVTEKQIVAVMESMKMETALQAPKGGRVSEIRSRPGQVVDVGEIILVID
jgi:acetyl/propionyl-CoA carboxylase alpha subunit